jgi:protein-S-isoprenylcysteine O-methyltransferase Ste14
MPLMILSLALIVAGTAASIYVASNLGQSFSKGPYRYVRHPLYLAEWITVIGISLQYQQPWALFIGVSSMLVQLPRMHFEEAVLTETYPQYGAYARSTARLVPGLY